MQHPDFKHKVLDDYASSTPANKRLSVQCQIAQVLLQAETEEVKAQIRHESAEEHEKLLEAHRNAVEGLPTTNEEDREM
jgi:hypothetical protein